MVRNRFNEMLSGVGAGRLLVFAVLSGLFLISSNVVAQAECRDHPGPGVDWSKCSKERLLLNGQNLNGANFEHTFLSGTGMQETNLTDANFHMSEIVRASFIEADLTGANFEKTLASRANFSGAILRDAKLSKAEFLRVSFVEADLTNANMSNGDFYRNDFSGAILAGADMTGAIMPRGVFHGADMTGAVLTGAFLFRSRFEGVDLSQIKGLEQNQIDQICGDDATTLPEGLSRPAIWPCNED